MPQLRRPLLAAAMIALIAGLCALGMWQIQRRTWKLALIAQVEHRLAAPPIGAPGPDEWSAIGKDDVYTRVVAQGVWRPIKPVLTQATTELGGGYWVLSPLDVHGGFTVIVNRGFVPLGYKGALIPSGLVTLTGLLRQSEPEGGFLRSNVPAEDRWYSRDVAAIASARHFGPVAPYFIDADAVPGQPIPRGGMTVVRFPNNHLVYAFTWFGLAALMAFMTWRVTRAPPAA